MLPIIVYLLDALRRALNRSGRGVLLLIDVFGEAMRDWRNAGRKYPYAE